MSRQNSICYLFMESPLGEIMLAATGRGLCWISFDTGESALISLKQWGKRWLLCDHIQNTETPILQETVQQLKEYFAGARKEFDLPLDVYGTTFQKLVWEQLRQIPYGEVRSYKDVALALGSKKAVRAVGGANNKNPLSIIVPCHRVIGSNGALVGYGGGLNIKEYLLRLEAAMNSGGESERKAQ
jgi:methylated-DNA-[protein]-cysteine S-methyltransferase